MSDPTQRFSSRVDAYARYRPGYPPTLVPALEKEAALRPGSTIADLGAGTGKSCEPFLLAGYSVVAVEPNAAMRAALDDSLADFPSWESVDGRAEATGLGDASVDAVFAGQAFHWFDQVATKREVSRILKPGGLCILAWYERDLDASVFEREYEAVLVQRCPEYSSVRKMRDFDVGTLAEFYAPSQVRRLVLPQVQALDEQALIGRVMSGSYAPQTGPEHDALVADVVDLFRRHQVGGTVELHYETRVHYGHWTSPH
jgi:SAM-dependent methyltransferase